MLHGSGFLGGAEMKTIAPTPAQTIRATPETAARLLVDHLYQHRFPPVPGVDIGTAYKLADDATRVGGDLIDVYRFNNGSVAISIADISGKGAAAAARAALVKFGLRAYVSAGFTPAQVLRNLNVFYMETSEFDGADPDSFVTVFLGIVDPEHKIMTYASAGHELAALLSHNIEAHLLPPTAPIIGVFEETHKLFHQRLVSLQPEATLIVATDGITEARSPAGEFIAPGRVMQWVEEGRMLPAREQAGRLLHRTLEFSGAHARDDIAIVAARFV